jgi:threonine aldolase
MVDHVIDLRSDTVTRPTPGMLAAMGAARVGDDVWGDDPTVAQLQDTVAQRAGKEAALFLPSGTQSNLTALMAHCERGDEYLVGQHAHCYKYEGGGAAVLGSIVPQPIENEADGSLPLAKLAEAIKAHGPGMGAHFARTRLLALENTFNGQVVPAGYLREATDFAHGRGLTTHLDGARVCNAAVAQGIPLAQACAPFDTVSICFSKGLGAPVGSVLTGSKALIERAYRWRKVLGGGLRQSGFLAAACLYALEHHYDRLAEDHHTAELLAKGLADIPEVTVVGQATNMVFARFPESHCRPLEAYLAERGILTQVVYESRLVTHLDVTPADIASYLGAVKQYFA